MRPYAKQLTVAANGLSAHVHYKKQVLSLDMYGLKDGELADTRTRCFIQSLTGERVKKGEYLEGYLASTDWYEDLRGKVAGIIAEEATDTREIHIGIDRLLNLLGADWGRAAKVWKDAMNQFAILYAERFEAARG